MNSCHKGVRDRNRVGIGVGKGGIGGCGCIRRNAGTWGGKWLHHLAGSRNVIWVTNPLGGIISLRLFRSCAPVSVEDGYFACVPGTYPDLHSWSYPDWYLAASPGVKRNRKPRPRPVEGKDNELGKPDDLGKRKGHKARRSIINRSGAGLARDWQLRFQLDSSREHPEFIRTWTLL
eukprot:gene14679-biopygen4026